MLDGQDRAKNPGRRDEDNIYLTYGLSSDSQPTGRPHSPAVKPKRKKPGSEYSLDPLGTPKPQRTYTGRKTDPSFQDIISSEIRLERPGSRLTKRRRHSPSQIIKSDLSSPTLSSGPPAKIKKSQGEAVASRPTNSRQHQQYVEVIDDSPVSSQAANPIPIPATPSIPTHPALSGPLGSRTPSSLRPRQTLTSLLNDFRPQKTPKRGSMGREMVEDDELRGPANMPRELIHPSPPSNPTNMAQSNITFFTHPRTGGLRAPSIPSRSISSPLRLMHITHFQHMDIRYTCRDYDKRFALTPDAVDNLRLQLKRRVNTKWEPVNGPGPSNSPIVFDFRQISSFVAGKPGGDITTSKIHLIGKDLGPDGKTHLSWQLEFVEAADLDKVTKKLSTMGCTKNSVSVEELQDLFRRTWPPGQQSPLDTTSPSTSPLNESPIGRLLSQAGPVVNVPRVLERLRPDNGIETTTIHLHTRPPKTRIQKRSTPTEFGLHSVPKRSSPKALVPPPPQPPPPVRGVSVKPPQIYGPLLNSDKEALSKKLTKMHWPQLVHPLKGPRRATVVHADLERLRDKEYLNDSIIEFYLRYLQEHYLPTDTSSTAAYFFNTHFYSILTGSGRGIDYDGIARWTNKEDLFSKDLVVIPINEDAHWYLAVVFNLKSIPKFFEELEEEKKSKRLDEEEAMGAEQSTTDDADIADASVDGPSPPAQMIPSSHSPSMPFSGNGRDHSPSHDPEYIEPSPEVARTTSASLFDPMDPIFDSSASQSTDLFDPSNSIELQDSLLDIQMTDADPQPSNDCVEMVDISHSQPPSHVKPKLDESITSLPSASALIGTPPTAPDEPAAPRRSRRIQEYILNGPKEPMFGQPFRPKTSNQSGQKQSKASLRPTNGQKGTAASPERMPSPPPCIVIFDSLRAPAASSRTIANIKDYLIAEAKAKRQWNLERKIFQGMNARNIPQQTTSYDCGVYLLYYVDAILRDWKAAFHSILQNNRSGAVRKSLTTRNGDPGSSGSGSDLSRFDAGAYGQGRRLGSAGDSRSSRLRRTTNHPTPMIAALFPSDAEMADRPSQDNGTRPGLDLRPRRSQRDKRRQNASAGGQSDAIVDLVSDEEEKETTPPPAAKTDDAPEMDELQGPSRLLSSNFRAVNDDHLDNYVQQRWGLSSIEISEETPSDRQQRINGSSSDGTGLFGPPLQGNTDQPKHHRSALNNAISDSDDDVLFKPEQKLHSVAFSVETPSSISDSVSRPANLPTREDRVPEIDTSRTPRSDPVTDPTTPRAKNTIATAAAAIKTPQSKNATATTTTPTPRKAAVLEPLPWPWAQINAVRYRLQIADTLDRLAVEQEQMRVSTLHTRMTGRQQDRERKEAQEHGEKREREREREQHVADEPVREESPRMNGSGGGRAVAFEEPVDEMVEAPLRQTDSEDRIVEAPPRGVGFVDQIVETPSHSPLLDADPDDQFVEAPPRGVDRSDRYVDELDPSPMTRRMWTTANEGTGGRSLWRRGGDADEERPDYFDFP